jgi:Cu2+-exporting ATPase
MSVPPASADHATATPQPTAAAALSHAAQSTCYHCGLPNPRSERHRALVGGAERGFCCAGCSAIAQAIHAAGLDAFYARRTARGERPQPEHVGEFDAWDDAAPHAGLVRVRGDRAEASLLLEGVHCGACVWLIESWLARQPGVVEASANFATRRARVIWNPAATRLSALLCAVARIGYRAHPYDPARREALARHEARTLLTRTAIALLAMMQVMMFAVPTYVSVDGVEAAHRRLLEWASLTLTLPVVLYSAFPFFRGAWRDLRLRRAGMDIPVALGIGAAFAASAWATLTGSGAVYYDSVTMFVALLLCARYLELSARRKSGDAIEAAARARPQVAERLVAWPLRDDGESVAAATLVAGDLVRVRPGATVPADGVVVDGRAAVEEAVLTGESNPIAKRSGARVLAGSVVRDGALVVRVEAAGESTRIAAIERLSERAASERPRVARLADRVASWFVGALLGLACVVALVWFELDPSRALAVTFAVLVVSCPCALSLATPAALAAATGALSRRHVVVARADALETLAKATHVVLDKTGTLTSGRLALERVVAIGDTTREEALAIAAALEAASEHPIAEALRANAHDLDVPVAHSVSIVSGHGVEGVVDGARFRLGRVDFAGGLSGAPVLGDASIRDEATLVALGGETGLRALFVLADSLRPGARELVTQLRALAIEPVVLSGDRASSVCALAQSLGVGDARGELAPDDKRAAVAALQARGAIVAMAGDGINDAPSLAQAQASISLGSATPLAQWTADVVVLSSELPRIAETIVHARRASAVVRQNLGWAFAYNAIAIPAAALGFVSPLIAAIGMSASSLVVVANALRLARVR